MLEPVPHLGKLVLLAVALSSTYGATALGQELPSDDEPIPGVYFARPFQDWSVLLSMGTPGMEPAMFARFPEPCCSPGRRDIGGDAGVALRQYFGLWYLDLDYRLGTALWGTGRSQVTTHLAVPLTSWDGWDSGKIVVSSTPMGYNTFRITYVEGLVPTRSIVSLLVGQSSHFLHLTSPEAKAAAEAREPGTDFRYAYSLDLGARYLRLTSGAIDYQGEVSGTSRCLSATLLTRTDPRSGTLVSLGLLSPWVVGAEAGGFVSSPSHGFFRVFLQGDFAEWYR
jgi:hypothetical protein